MRQGSGGEVSRGRGSAVMGAARLSSGRLVASLGIGLLLLVPAPLWAQRAEVIPQIGFFTPLTSLGTAEAEGGSALSVGERERGFAYGAAVQFGGATPAGVRGSLLFGTGSDVPLTGPGCPEENGCAVEGNVRMLTGALVVRPLPGLIALQPYVLAGGGWKRFGFDEAELEGVGLDGAIEDHTKTAWQLGVGVELSLGLTGVVVELNDFISGFDVDEERGDGKTQHDIFLTVGLRL